MADEDTELEAEVEAGASKSGGLMQKLMMAGAALGLMAIGVFVGPLVMNMMSGSPDDEGAEEDAVEEVVELAVADGPALYQSLLPPLVINIKNASGSPHFMQMSMEAMARDQDVINAIREHTPVIRNNLILLYGNATYESVTTREGKEKLLRDGLAEIQSILKPHIGNRQVEALYFTALVVQ
jgi:flagellar FliL protein